MAELEPQRSLILGWAQEPPLFFSFKSTLAEGVLGGLKPRPCSCTERYLFVYLRFFLVLNELRVQIALNSTFHILAGYPDRLNNS